ncbi:MAG: UDP-N-acetylmuramoyl-L-alanyl-D-glutamate--2,6-diaminopimelate ligase, partial [Chthonomonadales bacterium]
MILSKLAKALNIENMGDVDVIGISHDTRSVRPGDLFVCLIGANHDGHMFIAEALDRGAAAIAVCSGRENDVPKGIPYLSVVNTRESLPSLASTLYGDPSNSLVVVGVTGTNGKTTITKMIASILRSAGKRVGTIGTLGIDLDGEIIDSDRTTPEADELQSVLKKMVDRKGDAVVMEVSSHAICEHRTESIGFDAAVFSNLTAEHLDYHITMRAYFAAKATLFTEYPNASAKKFVAAINIDDPWGRQLTEISRGTVLTYGIEKTSEVHAADVRATDVKLATEYSSFHVHTPNGDAAVRLSIGGAFQVSNALSAIAVCLGLGIDLPTIVKGLAELRSVAGRFESVPTGRDFQVIVDYSHTPDALQNLVDSARALNPGRLVTVFGCGGDRDTTKRPKMGRIAADNCEVTIVTSDNPRTEDPNEIIRQIMVGMENPKAQVICESNRREAIHKAVKLAKARDIVLIAGKGHETYQTVGKEVLPFDDRLVAREALAEL